MTMLKIHRIPLLARAGVLALTAAVSLMVGACASEPPQAAETQGEIPEGYTSWEAYWEAKDQKQKDFESDKARYRMQLDRQRSGPMRR